MSELFEASVSDAFEKFGDWFFCENDIRTWVLHCFMSRVLEMGWDMRKEGLRIFTDYPPDKKYDIAIVDNNASDDKKYYLVCELKYYWDGFDSRSLMQDIEKLEFMPAKENYFICAVKNKAWITPGVWNRLARKAIKIMLWEWDEPIKGKGSWRRLYFAGGKIESK